MWVSLKHTNLNSLEVRMKNFNLYRKLIIQEVERFIKSQGLLEIVYEPRIYTLKIRNKLRCGFRLEDLGNCGRKFSSLWGMVTE